MNAPKCRLCGKNHVLGACPEFIGTGQAVLEDDSRLDVDTLPVAKTVNINRNEVTLDTAEMVLPKYIANDRRRDIEKRRAYMKEYMRKVRSR